MPSPATSTAQSPLRAVLVGIQLPGVSDAELASSLDELGRLATTLGLRPVARLTQRRAGTGHQTVVGAGKLKELARLTGGTGVVPSTAANRQTGTRPAEPEPAEDADAESEIESDAESDSESDGGADAGADGASLPEAERARVVVFDHDLTPAQLRHLEAATDAQVLDRSSVILGIFERHARTREARLQVEIARLAYLAPRLRATGGGGDRQRGGIGGRGAGESSLELDRRRVRHRVAELRQELEAVQREAIERRARRVRTDTVALVGYTNAGKSSLMRALTGSEPLIADQLFATLDTTVRVLKPETHPRILVSDTVGFIKKLPHDLVASFRSTLEEAREATLLVHVVDAADPAWRSQLDVTREVLAEIGAADRPSLIALNKADRLSAEEIAALEAEHPDGVILSALRAEDVARLHGRLRAFFEADMIDEELFVPYAEQRLVHVVHEACRVLGETHDDSGTRLRVRAPRALLATLRARIDQRPAS